MKFSLLMLCLAVDASLALWHQITKLTDMASSFVPDAINPLNLVFVNRCVSDLGCFYTGPPFFHPINRAVSLPPTSHPRVRFLLYTPRNPGEGYLLRPSAESLRNSNFDPNLPTRFLIHGFWMDVIKGDSRFETKDALLMYEDSNVIIVDWTKHNGVPYARAVANTRVVGAVIAKLIEFLMDEVDLDPQKVHLIGHSLGAHVAGYAGKRIPNLGRITGLDPAGPYFQETDREVRLDASDAFFVDNIHTDGAEFVLTGLGISAPIGHMDFYPNGGHRQPGCVRPIKEIGLIGSAIKATKELFVDECDHSLSTILFMESINATWCQFWAKRCESYSQFKAGNCGDSAQAQMGFHAEKITGAEPEAKFFLRTNAESPFCVNSSNSAR